MKEFLPITPTHNMKPKLDRTHGLDQSGTKFYRHNRLGFRGEDYDPGALKRIYLSGCSHTYGTGLDWSETFGYRFKVQYSHDLRMKVSDVNLMSFAVGGSSNSYNVRMLMSQSNVVRPDLILCNFSHKKNMEFKGENAIENYCPSRPTADLSVLDHPYCNSLNLFIQTMKDILLLQYYCEAHDLPYVFAWVDFHTLDLFLEPVTDTHDFLRQEINFDHFLSTSLTSPSFVVDHAADGKHTGPLTNKKYGDLMYRKYVSLYGWPK